EAGGRGEGRGLEVGDVARSRPRTIGIGHWLHHRHGPMLPDVDEGPAPRATDRRTFGSGIDDCRYVGGGDPRMTAPTSATARSRTGWLVAGLLAAAALWVGLFALNEVAWTAVLGDWFGLDLDGRLAGSVHFFLYDVVKILLLLVGLIFL